MRGLVAGLVLLGAVAATSVVSAQTVTQSYTAAAGVQKGMIVRLDPKNDKRVEPLTDDKVSAMQGVVIAANDSAVTLTGDGTDQVYVATIGKYNVLVSDQNGPIKPGDYITISSLAGIGMKTGDTQALVLGKALSSFDGSSGSSSTADLTTTGGDKLRVSIGLVTVDVGIARNPLMVTNVVNVPSFLARAGQAIADKQVSTFRLYLGLTVLFITLVIVGSFLYGGVRSGVTAIGRNPLAKRSITRGLVQVMLIGTIIFVIGLLAVYLILKL